MRYKTQDPVTLVLAIGIVFVLLVLVWPSSVTGDLVTIATAGLALARLALLFSREGEE